ncbi:MAG: FAD-dependent oxidoreductase [Bacteroidales bacterium]|nr:FAD-dependent oxidoreductase [Bacteroidales bacterium]
MMFNTMKVCLCALLCVLCIAQCTPKDEPYVEHIDVLVIGGGASGIAAGIQSARMEVPTMVVEETPWIGGMLTSAGVSCVDGNYNLRSGIFGEFADSLAKRYGGWEELKTGWVSHINFEPHVGQEVLTDMATSCGEYLDVRRQTSVRDVKKVGDSWEVLIMDKDGNEYKVTADVLIDGTELGDVAKACGVEYRIGMESASQTGESIAPEKANDIIQDLTYVAILKDYGPDADMTIAKPEGYDPAPFYNSAVNPHNTLSETGQTIWPAENMITYGAIPNGKYMINWPIYGNDYYVNSIEMTPEERNEAYKAAKNFTLSFLYFIQTELGMKNLGLADDEFPTEDKLPFFPYHRESRRIVGEAFFTVDAAARPYDFNYYRTGIAVGDYAVDHHHFRHPQWRNLPDLHFYPIPSYNVPMGVMLPKNTEGLIVAEKSVSVSNLVNGTTRLQPVVLQLGQAAGALAALSQLNDIPVKEVDIRKVQEVLLASGCYIMPYLDLPSDHPHFKVLQRIGVTGILRGEGRNVGWANQTWFRAEDPLLAEDLYMEEFLHGDIGLDEGAVTVGEMMTAVRNLGGRLSSASDSECWKSLGLDSYDPERVATRLEAAVVIDSAFDPFNMLKVDYNGNYIR